MPIALKLKIFICPLVITMIAPMKEMMMPINFVLPILSRKKTKERIDIKAGFKDTMTEALDASIYFMPEKKK